MTQENARKFVDYLRMKVDFWREATENEYDVGFDKAIARHEVYAFVLAKFEEMSKDAPTETLHEMAKRMCNSFEDCDGCPLEDMGLHCAVGVRSMLTESQAEAQFAALRAWAAENPPKPVKTYRDDFFEKFPNAPKMECGCPIVEVDSFCEVNETHRDEFRRIPSHNRWIKPLGYWEA